MSLKKNKKNLIKTFVTSSNRFPPNTAQLQQHQHPQHQHHHHQQQQQQQHIVQHIKQRQHMDGISSASHSHVNSPNTTPAHISNHIMQASASEDETLQSGISISSH